MVKMITLTETQQKIYWCMIQGYSIKETAFIVKRSMPTVKKHRRIINKIIGRQKVSSLQRNMRLNLVKVLPKIDTLTLQVFTTNGKKCTYNKINGKTGRARVKQPDGTGEADNLRGPSAQLRGHHCPREG